MFKITTLIALSFLWSCSESPSDFRNKKTSSSESDSVKADDSMIIRSQDQSSTRVITKQDAADEAFLTYREKLERLETLKDEKTSKESVLQTIKETNDATAKKLKKTKELAKDAESKRTAVLSDTINRLENLAATKTGTEQERILGVVSSLKASMEKPSTSTPSAPSVDKEALLSSKKAQLQADSERKKRLDAMIEQAKDGLKDGVSKVDTLSESIPAMAKELKAEQEPLRTQPAPKDPMQTSADTARAERKKKAMELKELEKKLEKEKVEMVSTKVDELSKAKEAIDAQNILMGPDGQRKPSEETMAILAKLQSERQQLSDRSKSIDQRILEIMEKIRQMRSEYENTVSSESSAMTEVSEELAKSSEEAAAQVDEASDQIMTKVENMEQGKEPVDQATEEILTSTTEMDQQVDEMTKWQEEARQQETESMDLETDSQADLEVTEEETSEAEAEALAAQKAAEEAARKADEEAKAQEELCAKSTESFSSVLTNRISMDVNYLVNIKVQADAKFTVKNAAEKLTLISDASNLNVSLSSATSLVQQAMDSVLGTWEAIKPSATILAKTSGWEKARCLMAPMSSLVMKARDGTVKTIDFSGLVPIAPYPWASSQDLDAFIGTGLSYPVTAAGCKGQVKLTGSSGNYKIGMDFPCSDFPLSFDEFHYRQDGAGDYSSIRVVGTIQNNIPLDIEVKK